MAVMQHLGCNLPLKREEEVLVEVGFGVGAATEAHRSDLWRFL